jgi:hypothetical protein
MLSCADDGSLSTTLGIGGFTVDLVVGHAVLIRYLRFFLTYRLVVLNIKFNAVFGCRIPIKNQIKFKLRKFFFASMSVVAITAQSPMSVVCVNCSSVGWHPTYHSRYQSSRYS